MIQEGRRTLSEVNAFSQLKNHERVKESLEMKLILKPKCEMRNTKHVRVVKTS